MIKRNLILCELCRKTFFQSNKVKTVNNIEYETCPYCNGKWISYLNFPN